MLEVTRGHKYRIKPEKTKTAAYAASFLARSLHGGSEILVERIRSSWKLKRYIRCYLQHVRLSLSSSYSKVCPTHSFAYRRSEIVPDTASAEEKIVKSHDSFFFKFYNSELKSPDDISTLISCFRTGMGCSLSLNFCGFQSTRSTETLLSSDIETSSKKFYTEEKDLTRWIHENRQK
ncbi:hypothetical protein Y032_0014g2316 [Ancylostoma ceylanicum]|nr:hypothetical protein Y032_0014g2316 [Ancylostoma ceylanicum]